jgi:hypothetical protein
VAAALELLAARTDGADSREVDRRPQIVLADDGTYLGAVVRTAERLMEIADNGQALLSAPTAGAVTDLLPNRPSLVDLGLHRLRDLSSPIRVFELRDRDRTTESVPLRSLDRVPHNLPIHLTGFVGRHSELAALRARSARSRVRRGATCPDARRRAGR